MSVFQLKNSTEDQEDLKEDEKTVDAQIKMRWWKHLTMMLKLP